MHLETARSKTRSWTHVEHRTEKLSVWVPIYFVVFVKEKNVDPVEETDVAKKVLPRDLSNQIRRRIFHLNLCA